MVSNQEKINLVLGTINLLSNTLNVVNVEMGIIPSSGSLSGGFQKSR